MNFGAFLSSKFLAKLKAVFGKTYWQPFELTPTTANGNLVTTDTISDLDPTKLYKLTGHIRVDNNGINGSATTYRVNGSDVDSSVSPNTTLAYIRTENNSIPFNGFGCALIFKPLGNSIRLEVTSNNSATGRLLAGSYIFIEELPNHEQTTKWTQG